MTREEWERTERLKLLDTNLSARVINAIGRGYVKGNLSKPIEELTDQDLLALRGFGPVALYRFRKEVPVPPAPAPSRWVWQVPTDKGDFWFEVLGARNRQQALALVMASCLHGKMDLAGMIPRRRLPRKSDAAVSIKQAGKSGPFYAVSGSHKFWAALGRLAEYEALKILEDNPKPTAVRMRESKP